MLEGAATERSMQLDDLKENFARYYYDTENPKKIKAIYPKVVLDEIKRLRGE